MIPRTLLAFFLSAAPVAADTLMAVRVVRPNAIIAPEDISVSQTAIAGALPGDADIIGLEAKVTLYPGRPILPAHVGPAALVERNQPVSLIYRSGGLTISTEARALSRGAVGDSVRVMNLASRSTVVGRIRSDGSVEVDGNGGLK
ncbi:MAG: flagellar basal body P-ring formation chaperone FlgA [Paracoccaceae bacterium]|nr:flagellar basal body P-ring formation chaperone FlgA [Paracoccaceae bacterium]